MRIHRNGVELDSAESRMYFGTPKRGEIYILPTDPNPLDRAREILSLFDSIQAARTDEQFILLERHGRVQRAKTRAEFVAWFEPWGDP